MSGQYNNSQYQNGGPPPPHYYYNQHQTGSFSQHPSYSQQGYLQQGFPQHSYAQNSYPQHGYPQPGPYPQQGYQYSNTQYSHHVSYDHNRAAQQAPAKQSTYGQPYRSTQSTGSDSTVMASSRSSNLGNHDAIDTSHIEVEWMPHSTEIVKIDKWFHSMDKDGRGIVKGMDIAVFLKQTHLPRDVLKAIWSLVDKDNLGYVNKTQFNTIIRLVSLSCSPIYMGAKPTLERFKETLYEDIPLPSTLTIFEEQPKPVELKPDGTAVASTPTQSSLPPQSPHDYENPHSPQQIKNNFNFPNDTKNLSSYHDANAKNQSHAVQINESGRNANLHVMEDFSHFTSANSKELNSGPGITPFDLHHSESPQINGSNIAYVGDALTNVQVKLDVPIINDDDQFSDFTSANTLASHDAPNLNQFNNVGGTNAPEADDFSDFTSANAPASNEVTNLNQYNVAGLANIPGADDIMQISSVNSLTHSEVQSENLIIDATNVAPATKNVSPWRQPSSDGIDITNRMAAFDELVENDMQALQEDWDDFAEASNAPNVSESTVINGNPVNDSGIDREEAPPESDPFGLDLLDVPLTDNVISSQVTDFTMPYQDIDERVDDDDFGDFSAHAASFEPPISSQHIAMDASKSQNVTSDNYDEDDDFGDFSVHAASLEPPISSQHISTDTSKSHDVTSDNFNKDNEFGDFEDHYRMPSNLSGLPPIHPPSNLSQENFSDEDDEFGGFETHSPTPGGVNSATQSSKLDSSSHTGFGNDSYQSTFEGSEFSAPFSPTTQSEKLEAAAFVQSVDLLDFLSEPIQTNTAPTVGNDIFGNLKALDNSAGTTNSSANLSVGNLLEIDSPAKLDPPIVSQVTQPTDTFLSGFPVENENKKAHVQIYDSAMNRTESEDNASKKRKPLTVSELEMLSLILSEKHLYEDAYNAIRQSIVLREMNEMLEQKQAALEADNFDEASLIKHKINSLAMQLESPLLEEVWERSSQSSRCGETLEETAELVEMIDETLGKKFRRRFLGSSMPQDSAPLDERMKFCVMARRCARMTVTRCSTHPNHNKYWEQILRVVLDKIKEGKMIIANFRMLRSSDRAATRTHDRLQSYGSALTAIAEIGMMTSVSCIEAMIHEKVSGEIFSSCKEILQQAKELWGIENKLSDKTIKEMIVDAARLAERSLVSYCGITLRPLYYELPQPKTQQSTEGVTFFPLYKPYANVNGVLSVTTLINLWHKNISKSLPDCGTPFT